jgi:hypothetical protein
MSDWTPEFIVTFEGMIAYQGDDPVEAERIFSDTASDAERAGLKWTVNLKQRPVGPWVVMRTTYYEEEKKTSPDESSAG